MSFPLNRGCVLKYKNGPISTEREAASGSKSVLFRFSLLDAHGSCILTYCGDVQ